VPSQLIGELAEQSKVRIERVRSELHSRLTVTLPASEQSKICIYATGSLARLEANKFSDLDAFFYVTGGPKDRLDPVHEITTFYNVIETAKVTDFPDFSGGGEYLHFQRLDDVICNIGSREDDYINGLTSRMLLMLESTHLFNELQFNNARHQIIERYFVDFHDHSADFRPIFILNDVLRFWRTLCLNYEHKREWRDPDLNERSKGHLKNLKLRFSRLMICYSFVGALLQEGPALNADQVMEIAAKTPIERIRTLADADHSAQELVSLVLTEYDWFLGSMNAPKEQVLSWIGEEGERVAAFRRSKAFITTMYRLMLHVSERHDYTRYLVI
jgi:hypothetical protein